MRFTILLFLLVSFSCQNNKINTPQVPTEIEKLVFDLVGAWSDRDADYITDSIYGAPFVLFLEDTTIFLNDFENIKTFLSTTFSTLESSNYSHSTFNKWETFKLRGNTALLEMSFTRFKKNGDVLGEKERTVTYILKKFDKEEKYRIFSIIAHTVIDS
ncbi:MAG: hypothetical protein CMF99_05510 [Candidatus Marinimicrobia bacterium]|nr:hypothetical protein [Candidatus Neomarinimicrobiota bacterium]